MSRRFVHLLLALALLTSVQGWATDLHLSAPAPGEEVQWQADGAGGGDSHAAGEFCHFGHCGGAHLTGLAGVLPALPARPSRLPTRHLPWAVITHPGERSGKPPRA